MNTLLSVLVIVFLLLSLGSFVLAMWLVFKMTDYAYESFGKAMLCFFLAIVSWMCIPVFGMIAQHIAQLLTS